MKFAKVLLLIVACNVLAIVSSRKLKPKRHVLKKRPAIKTNFARILPKAKPRRVKPRLNPTHTVNTGSQSAKSQKNKCHQYFTPGASLVVNEGSSLFDVTSCQGSCNDDIVPITEFTQTATTSTLSGICTTHGINHQMCTQIVTSANTDSGCQCADAQWLGQWKYVPQNTPKIRYMIKCSQSEGYTYYVEKRFKGEWTVQVSSAFLPANAGVNAPGGGPGNPVGGPNLGRRRRRLLQAGTHS